MLVIKMIGIINESDMLAFSYMKCCTQENIQIIKHYNDFVYESTILWLEKSLVRVITSLNDFIRAVFQELLQVQYGTK